ncbi:helix-turn-helix domain-containing protein [Gordonia alkaliphila]|uniref:HTH araC/xylS-type domain-containing protein n=1 Tax=Gordonia alkaliphila TaxID=1053547 RepID=A0ABP8YZS4_9ACTN|nr:helix-turn-helix domain-containing protein [Gordonia alkaliphila]MCK0439213.1 helix-turn-helix domain-containing protein [Gordonia alkaliphila]
MELRHLRRLSGTTITPYRILGAAPGTHLGLPSPTVTLIVDLGRGLTLSTDTEAPRTFDVAVGGMHPRPVVIHHDGSQVGVQLALPPHAVRALLGVRAGDVYSANLPLEALRPGLARRLHDGLGALADLPSDAVDDDSAVAQRRVTVALLADALSGPHPDVPVDPDAEHVWARLAATRGRVTVAQLVEESGWSARKLTASFHAEYGLGIKAAARLFRFDHALAALSAGVPLAETAAACGYADQAHLSREFTAHSGLPPRALLRRRAAEFADAA